MKSKLIAALGLCGLFASLSNLQGEGSGQPTAFKRIAMEYLFDELINRGAPVAFVQIPVKSSDGITAGDRIRQIESISETDRTPREMETLATLKRGLSQGLFPASSNVDFKQKTYSIELPTRLDDAKTADETLHAVAALDSRYELLQFGRLYVLCPANDPIKTQRVSLTLKEVPAAQAIDALATLLHPQGIDYTEVMAMPVAKDGKIYGDTRITLNLVNVPIVELLSRFAEALGPNYTWDLMTIVGNGRNFGFTHYSPSTQH